MPRVSRLSTGRGGWTAMACLAILSFLATVTYARAISVSHSPSLTTTKARQEGERNHHRCHHNSKKRQLRPIALRKSELSGRKYSSNDLDVDYCEDDEEDNSCEDMNDSWCLVEGLRGGGAKAAAKTAVKATEKPWVEGLKNSMASALAAAFSKTILAPFDTIKTLQQYHQSSASMTSLSLMEAAKLIAERPGGLLNFYAGLGVSVLGAMPSVAMYFGTYSYFKNALSEPRTRPDGTTYTLPRSFVVGMSAAIGNTFASFSRVPYEVLKQKLQTNTYRTTMEAIRDVTSWDMIFPKGGIAIQMMRDIPYAVVTLLLYENLQAWSIQRRRQNEAQQLLLLAKGGKKKRGTATIVSSKKKGGGKEIQQASSDMLLGAMAGGMGSWVTNPLDVIKTRLQTAPPEVYDGSITKCVLETWNEGGGMAFLRGSVPRLAHKIPANGFFFLFYEFFRRVFRCQGYE